MLSPSGRDLLWSVPAGESGLNLPRQQHAVRCLAVFAACAALCLAGCGRKSGLDPPPAAAVIDPTAPLPVDEGRVPLGPDGRPIAPPPVAPRRTFLDWLID